MNSRVLWSVSSGSQSTPSTRRTVAASRHWAPHRPTVVTRGVVVVGVVVRRVVVALVGRGVAGAAPSGDAGDAADASVTDAGRKDSVAGDGQPVNCVVGL